MRPEPLFCVLCGTSDDAIATAMIRYRDEAAPFSYGPRCRDRAACRSRVLAAGEAWDVVDAAEPEPPEVVTHGGYRGGFSEAHRRMFDLARRFREGIG